MNRNYAISELTGNRTGAIPDHADPNAEICRSFLNCHIMGIYENGARDVIRHMSILKILFLRLKWRWMDWMVGLDSRKRKKRWVTRTASREEERLMARAGK